MGEIGDEKLPPLPDSVEKAILEAICQNCAGRGNIGVAPDGRIISCEECGGHEDALGNGINAEPIRLAIRRALMEEREACAELTKDAVHHVEGDPAAYESRLVSCAEVIRARPMTP